jgi:Lrp/AsnC family transcriptional regulator, leucine-responsive regulatory protein
MPNEALDTIDRRIVAALQEDGRLSNVDLANKVGLSPSPCLRRVNRLEREGYIESYRAVLGRKRIGLGLTVFVGVKIEGHADDRATTFEEGVVAMPEVIACHMIAGEVDYLLEVTVPDLDAYQQFLVSKLLNLPLVREVRSNIAIQTLKAGAPLPLAHLSASSSSSSSSSRQGRIGAVRPSRMRGPWRRLG